MSVSLCIVLTSFVEFLTLTTECVELMDNHMMQAINHSGLSAKTLPEVDSLFFKFQGTTSSINETSKLIKSIVNKHGCTKFQAARSAEEAEELWNHRKIALWSTLGWPDDADARVWTTDVCVPPSKLPQLVKETKEDMAESKLLSTIVGHVGDGTYFHAEQSEADLTHLVHQEISMLLSFSGTMRNSRSSEAPYIDSCIVLWRWMEHVPVSTELA